MRAVSVTKNFADWDRLERLAKEAFPPEEYLAPDQILQINGLDFLALYEKENFIGFMVVRSEGKLCYLFFLAIDPACRSAGYGGQALRLLRELYPGKQQVVDFERVDENAANREQREKRRRFYLRNGYRETGKFLFYQGVDYEIFCSEESFDFVAFQKMMKEMPVPGFEPVFYEA